MIDRLSNVNPKRDEAQGLIELIVALTVLSIGIGSLLTLLDVERAVAAALRSERDGAGPRREADRALPGHRASRTSASTSTVLNNACERRPAGPLHGSEQLPTSTIPVRVRPAHRHGAGERHHPLRRTALFRPNARRSSRSLSGPITAAIASTPTFTPAPRTGATTVAHGLRRRPQCAHRFDRSSRAAPRRSRRSTSRTSTARRS